MKTSIQHSVVAGALALATFGTVTMAHGQQGMNMADGQGMQATAQKAMSEGEIKKVDKETGTITVKHGELANVGMPPMTMAFKVKNPAMLNKVKSGDKVHFIVENIGGVFTITSIEVKQ